MDGKCHQSTVPGWCQALTKEADLSGILRCDCITYSHLAHLERMLMCIKIFFSIEMCFLGTGFWLRRGTGRPGELLSHPIPWLLPIHHQPTASRRTRKADPVFTFEWGLKRCHANTIDIILKQDQCEKHHAGTSTAQQGGTFQRAVFHMTRVSNLLRDCRPLSPPPFSSISHGLFSFFRNFN